MNIDEIKTVHQAVETWRSSVHAATKCNPDIDPWPIHSHRAWLLAELEKRNTELAWTKSALQMLQDGENTRIAKLEQQVNRTCLWELDDARWYPDALCIVGEKTHRDYSGGVYEKPVYCPACGGKVVSDE